MGYESHSMVLGKTHISDQSTMAFFKLIFPVWTCPWTGKVPMVTTCERSHYKTSQDSCVREGASFPQFSVNCVAPVQTGQLPNVSLFSVIFVGIILTLYGTWTI